MTIEQPTEPEHVSTKMSCMATAAVQNFDPLKPICQHQNAIHCYADEPQRQVFSQMPL